MATLDQSSGLLRLDVHDPKDVQTLVDRGWAWRSGPKTLQIIFAHIVGGQVTRVPDLETPQVRAHLDRLMSAPAVEIADPIRRALERHAEERLGPRWREEWVGIDRLGTDPTVSVAKWEARVRVADAGAQTLILAASHDEDFLLIRRIGDGSNRYWLLRGDRLHGPVRVDELPHAGDWSDIPEKRWVRIEIGSDRRMKNLTLATRPTDGWYAANP